MSICVSIVSHGQLNLINSLLNDLRKYYLEGSVKIIITINKPEDEFYIENNLDIVNKIIRNNFQKGFGANHNFAFQYSNQDFFLILNPDVSLNNLDLRMLSSDLLANKSCGIISPLVYSPGGMLEDSARLYPSFFNITKRLLSKNRKTQYFLKDQLITVDWVAGIFMLFKSDVFSSVNGFDEKYFMYLEDADICRRLSNLGISVLLSTKSSIIHDARRESHRNLKYFFWHIKSMFRFLFLAH